MRTCLLPGRTLREKYSPNFSMNRYVKNTRLLPGSNCYCTWEILASYQEELLQKKILAWFHKELLGEKCSTDFTGRFPIWSRVPPEFVSKCPWARLWTLNCSRWAGWSLARFPVDPVYMYLYLPDCRTNYCARNTYLLEKKYGKSCDLKVTNPVWLAGPGTCPWICQGVINGVHLYLLTYAYCPTLGIGHKQELSRHSSPGPFIQGALNLNTYVTGYSALCHQRELVFFLIFTHH